MRFARGTRAPDGGARRVVTVGMAGLVMVGGCGDSVQNRGSDRGNSDGAYAAPPEPPSEPASAAGPPLDLLPPESVPALGTDGPRASTQQYMADQALLAAAVGGDVGARISERMDEEAQRLTADSDLEGARIERVGEGIKATLVMGILFDDGSSELTPAALDYLSKVAVRLVEFPDTDILVVGHTDGQGSSELNLALSEARARAALEYLVSLDVERSRITAVGRGELEPLALDDSESDAAARENKRIELAIYAGAAMKESAGQGGVQ